MASPHLHYGALHTSPSRLDATRSQDTYFDALSLRLLRRYVFIGRVVPRHSNQICLIAPAAPLSHHRTSVTSGPPIARSSRADAVGACRGKLPRELAQTLHLACAYRRRLLIGRPEPSPSRLQLWNRIEGTAAMRSITVGSARESLWEPLSIGSTYLPYSADGV